MTNSNEKTPRGDRTAPASPNRRRLLQALSVGGVAAGAAAVPEKWVSPVVDAVTLPAHGQTTGAVFFGEGALSPPIVNRLLDSDWVKGIAANAPRRTGGWLDSVVPAAVAGGEILDPGDFPPGFEETLTASSSSFAFTQGFLSESNELTLRFDLIVNAETIPDGVSCDDEFVIPICFGGKVDMDKIRGLDLVNCPGGPPDDVIGAKIKSRNEDEVLLKIAIGPSEDTFMLFRGGSRPNCPDCEDFSGPPPCSID